VHAVPVVKKAILLVEEEGIAGGLVDADGLDVVDDGLEAPVVGSPRLGGVVVAKGAACASCGV
jgi:hypothetical protein